MKRVIILSGLPGSGKSTYAKELAKSGALVYSADSYFINGEGQYKFDVTKLSEAHNDCMRKFTRAVTNPGVAGNDVVVDNTNVSWNEINPYYRVAAAFGYKVSLITFLCTLDLSVKRNVHNVPISTIVRMFDTLQKRKVPEYCDLTQTFITVQE